VAIGAASEAECGGSPPPASTSVELKVSRCACGAPLVGGTLIAAACQARGGMLRPLHSDVQSREVEVVAVVQCGRSVSHSLQKNKKDPARFYTLNILACVYRVHLNLGTVLR
jgi:hypothetical protein